MEMENNKSEENLWETTNSHQSTSGGNHALAWANIFFRTIVTQLINILRRALCLTNAWMQLLRVGLLRLAGPKFQTWQTSLKTKVNEMLTAMDKGIEAAQVSTPPVGVYQGVDLRILPKFVAFKAAMLKERLTLQYVLAIHLAAFALNFTISRVEIHSLEKRLREKEYILAPGVMDFTPASPQSVSDSYVVNAAMSFLSQLGNINAANIDEQYKRLSDFMTAELRIQFLEEIMEWKEAVKNENISEILRVTDREVVASGDGNYKVTAIVQRERYSNSESLGHVDEVIEMTLRLVPPVKGKEWFLEIVSLKRTKADGFKPQSENQGGKAK